MDKPIELPIFSGEDFHSLDDKGRVAIPAKMRSYASLREEREQWYLTRGFEKCLLLFTGETWQYLLKEKLGNLSLGNKQHRSFIRSFVTPAVELIGDKQGRVLLPQRLREYASINDRVAILGANKYIEIWNEDIYKQEVDASFSADMDMVGETLEKIGF